jgi:signal transduction histidine kinase
MGEKLNHRAAAEMAHYDHEPTSARRIRDTDELLERERNARRQLEAEKTVRERLLAMLTRELVTQANVALGWLNLMRREHLNVSTRDFVFGKVSGALDAQLSLLDELVGMSPAAAGHVNLDCRRVDVATMARAVAADAGDERAYVVAAENAVVVADAEHVVRALRALVDATTRDAHSVMLDVRIVDESVRVRFSNAIHEHDQALSVARRVAALYGGALTVEGDETVFELPVEPAV